MAGKRIGYIRVSSVDQNPERQLAGIDLDRVFSDYVSGKSSMRPELQAMLAYARDGDTVYVHSLDRLARNLVDLRQLVTGLVSRDISINFVAENLQFSSDTSSPLSMLLLSLLGAFAEFERSIIKERQREGIAIAKAKGIYKGRRPSLTAAQIAEIKALLATGVPKAAIARRYHVSRETIYQCLKQAD